MEDKETSLNKKATRLRNPNNFPSTELMNELKKSEKKLKTVSAFVLCVFSGLIMKSFLMLYKGIYLNNPESSCDNIYQNFSVMKKIILIMISIWADNVIYLFVYFERVYKLRVFEWL